MTPIAVKDRMTDADVALDKADIVLQSLIRDLDSLLNASQIDNVTRERIRQAETLTHVLSDYLGKAIDAVQEVKEAV